MLKLELDGRGTLTKRTLSDTIENNAVIRLEVSFGFLINDVFQRHVLRVYYLIRPLGLILPPFLEEQFIYFREKAHIS